MNQDLTAGSRYSPMCHSKTILRLVVNVADEYLPTAFLVKENYHHHEIPRYPSSHLSPCAVTHCQKGQTSLSLLSGQRVLPSNHLHQHTRETLLLPLFCSAMYALMERTKRSHSKGAQTFGVLGDWATGQGCFYMLLASAYWLCLTLTFSFHIH